MPKLKVSYAHTHACSCTHVPQPGHAETHIFSLSEVVLLLGPLVSEHWAQRELRGMRNGIQGAQHDWACSQALAHINQKLLLVPMEQESIAHMEHIPCASALDRMKHPFAVPSTPA